MKKALITIAATAGAILVLAGCANNPAPVSPTGSPKPPTTSPSKDRGFEGSWKSEAENGPYFEIKNDELHGNDGCNTVGSSVKNVSKNEMDIDGLMSTMMYCSGVDTWFAKAKTLVLSKDSESITVKDETGKEIGTVVRTIHDTTDATPPVPNVSGSSGDYANGRWFPNGKQGESMVEIYNGNQVIATDGCNTIEGSVLTKEGKTEIKFVKAQDKKVCTEPGRWLANAETATVEGGKLVVKNKNEETLSTLERG